ncbi:hypothetical protein DKW60_02350 [Leucothrix pacifica]|uniref:DUF4184 domain-containing protein n=2 Tax=Leucothrix pacifica TaxID=1247513 RepID=A0A317CQM9_9GAMM|nr:hypothetical protein DKW60_02350 [Leucothrix pacifica]
MRENHLTNKKKYTMPFTLAHPVVSLPLKKYLGDYGALSALFIGAIVPDFVYMMPPEFVYYYRLESHTLMGLIKVCMPLGLLFYYFYHLLMAPVIVSAFPEILRRKLPRHLSLGQCPPLSNAHAIIVSLLIGAATHIIFDAFTHERHFPQYIELLRTPLASIDGYPIMPFRVIQHLGTIFGSLIIVWWTWHWFKTAPDLSEKTWLPLPPVRYSVIALLILIPSSVGMYFIYKNTPENGVLFGLHDIQHGLKYGIVAGGAALIVVSGALGAFYQLLLFSGRRKAQYS